MEREMRSAELRRKLVEETSMVISLHHIVGTVNLGTHVQCVCGAIVRPDDWYWHVAEIVVDRNAMLENKEENHE